MTTVKLYKIRFNRKDEYEYNQEAGLYDVCEWLVNSYPEDVFVSSDNPVHIMRDKAKEVLALRKREDS